MVCSRYPKEYRHYETVLKNKCFKKLRYNVWEQKTKWILIGKADYYYRTKLMYKYLNLWVTYVNECYKKKINCRTADAFHEKKLKIKGISALKTNVEQNWKFVGLCRKTFEWNLKYRCWLQWKCYVQKRLKVREIKLLANRIRERRLRIRFFYLWFFRLNEKLSLQGAYKAAAVKYETKLKGKCLKFWKIFADKQICRTKIKNLAVACYEDKLKEKYIRVWKKHTFKKKRYRYQITIIQNFYENYLLKNYLSHWFTAYKTLKFERKICKYTFAENFYNKKLLDKSFKILWKARETKRAREEKIQDFHNIYVKIYLNFYLNLWMEKLSEKIVWNRLEDKAVKWREDSLRMLIFSKLLNKYRERMEEKEEMRNVVKYSNAIIIHRAFRGWCEVTERKLNKKVQLENAAKLYSERLIKKTFEDWKKFAVMKSKKKMALEYFSFLLLSRCMNQWKTFFSEQKLKLTKARNLEKKYNVRLMKNALDCWKEEAKISESKLNAAIDFCDKLKLSKAFHIWKKNVQIKTVNKSCYDHNRTIINNIIIKNAIFRWYEMHLIKQKIKRKLQELKITQEKRSLGSIFNTWHKFVEKMKNIQENVSDYSQLRSNVLLEHYLESLLKAVRRKKMFNKKKELASKLEEKLLKKRYLKKWLSFISWKRERILRCISKEKNLDSRAPFEIFTPYNTGRRKPMIPDFLKADFSVDQLEEDNLTGKETFRVKQPINKKLPIIGQDEQSSFIFFEI